MSGSSIITQIRVLAREHGRIKGTRLAAVYLGDAEHRQLVDWLDKNHPVGYNDSDPPLFQGRMVVEGLEIRRSGAPRGIRPGGGDYS